MTADRLRTAAALMRERAEAATDDVCPEWTRQAVRHIARNCEIECYHDDALSPRHHDSEGEPNQWSRYDDAEHIASWHPDVTLAVADLLDRIAVRVEEYVEVVPARVFESVIGSECLGYVEALAVADAYLLPDADIAAVEVRSEGVTQ